MEDMDDFDRGVAYAEARSTRTPSAEFPGNEYSVFLSSTDEHESENPTGPTFSHFGGGFGPNANDAARHD